MMTTDEFKTAPAAPEAEDLADRPAATSEAIAPVAAAPNEANVSDEGVGHIPFYDRLAALIEAQALADGRGPEPDERPGHHDHDDATSANGIDVLDMSGEGRGPEGHETQQDLWQTGVDAVPPITDDVTSVLRRPSSAFILGATAAVAAGGVMFVFLVGTGEPPTIAANAANGPVERPLHAMADAQTGDTGITTGSITAARAVDRAANVTALMHQIEEIKLNRNEPAEAMRDPASPADAPLDAQNHRQGDAPLAEKSPAETIAFNTVVLPAGPDSEPTLPQTAPSTKTRTGRIASASNAAEDAAAIRTVQAVNMREGPDNREPVLAVIPEGSRIEVLKCEHWCEVTFAGQRGWVYKSLIGAAGATASFDR